MGASGLPFPAGEARHREEIAHTETKQRFAKLLAALKPFADAVYNDNGDMTVTPCNREAYIAAYFAMRALSSDKRPETRPLSENNTSK